MDKIDKFLDRSPKYKSLQKPLEAARVCDAARALANGRFAIVSFKNGLLTVGVANSMEAAEIQSESQKIVKTINEKLGQELVKRLRFKIV